MIQSPQKIVVKKKTMFKKVNKPEPFVNMVKAN